MPLLGSQPSIVHVATPDSLGNFVRWEFFHHCQLWLLPLAPPCGSEGGSRMWSCPHQQLELIPAAGFMPQHGEVTGLLKGLKLPKKIICNPFWARLDPCTCPDGLINTWRGQAQGILIFLARIGWFQHSQQPERMGCSHHVWAGGRCPCAWQGIRTR